MDDTVARVATRQALIDDGETDWTILRGVRDGLLRHPRWGVYATASDDEWHAALTAAVAGAGPYASAGLRSAARLHGFDGFDRASEIDVLMPYGHRSSHGARRSRSLGDADVTVIAGIRCTSKARTVLDLGRVCDADVVERACESALRVSSRLPDRIDEVVAADLARLAMLRGNRNGASTLRVVLGRRRHDARPTGSFAETVAIQVLRRAGIVDVERQVDLHVRTIDTTVHRWFGDLLVGGRLLVEINGAVAHGGGAMTARDLDRNTLIARYLDVHVSTAENVLRRPRTFVDDVVEALRRARPLRNGAVRTTTGFDLPR